MAKSSRSSSKKENNRRKAATVFGPVEAARAERLSARLQELAQQPKPDSSDVNMDAPTATVAIDEQGKKEAGAADETTMDVDSVKPSKTRVGRKRVDKRKHKKASVTFTKYSDRLAAKRKIQKSAV